MTRDVSGCGLEAIPTVAGPGFRRVDIFAALVFGVIVLVVQGVLPLLLGSLEIENRLSASGIGVAAAAEAITITLSCSIAGLFLAPVRLRLIACVSLLVLSIANLSILLINEQTGIIIARAITGVPEGILFWISLGTIARCATTERWGAVLNTMSIVGSVILTAASTGYVIPTFGINGAFVVLAMLSALSIAIVPFIPGRYVSLRVVDASGRGGIPSLQGWLALLGTMLYTAAGMGIFIYLLPLTQSVGLNTSIADTAITALLVGELIGGISAMFVAGRIGYFGALCVSSVAYLCIWPIYASGPGAWLFVSASAATGLITFFSIPFLFPFAVAADRSRRAALQSGPAQMLGTAVGPVLSAWAVDRYDVGSVVYLSGLLLAAGMGVVIAVHFTLPSRTVA
jgi:DHA1 family inner membrane transport protein